MSERDRLADDDIYVRYYVGHRGKFGHEFLEFEFRSDGRLRYANNSRYKNDTMIRKETWVSPLVLEALREMIDQAEILKESDNEWPPSDGIGRQELEIFLNGKQHEFITSKLGSLREIEKLSSDEGLKVFYYFVQDLKCLVLSLVSLHFRIKPL